MDPFLEDPEIWPGFHAKLAVEIQRQLNPNIGPKYYADVEVQSTLNSVDIETGSGNPIRPDVSIFEPFDVAVSNSTGGATTLAEPAPIVRTAVVNERLYRVRVFLTRTSQLVTSIEILSPANKRPYSQTLIQYRAKRVQLLNSSAHLVELDLLRGGERPGPEVYDDPIDCDYIVLVNRANIARLSAIWPIDIGKPFAPVPIPLLPPDDDVSLDLNKAVITVYAESGYDWRIRYKRPIPYPPLRPISTIVAEQLIATRIGNAEQE
jgi:hypothetical protein